MARRPDTLTADTRPLPLTADVLEEHYMPAMPECETAAWMRAAQLVHAHRFDLNQAVADAENLAKVRRADVITAALDGDADRLAAALRASVAADAELMRRRDEVTCLWEAAKQINTAQLAAQNHTDDVYRQWTQQCRQIKSEWREQQQWAESLNTVHPLDPRDKAAVEQRRAEREMRMHQAMAGFAATH